MVLPFLLLLLVPQQTQPPAYHGPSVVVRQDDPITPISIDYPAEAKAQRIQGVVKLEIAVDSAGKVFGVKAVEGPELLRQAAVAAYAKASFRPLYQDGKPVPAVVTKQITFHLEEEQPKPDSLDLRFLVLHRNCQQLSADHAPTALDVCQQAIETSRRFSPTTLLEPRVQAYNDLVLLLIAKGKLSPHLREAESLANDSIALIAGTNAHQPAQATAYISRAEVRSLAGNLKGAAADCTTAEETLQTLLRDEAENDKAANYRLQLRQLIELHALILDRDGKKDQAKRLRQQGTLLE